MTQQATATANATAATHNEHTPTTCYVCTRQAIGIGASPKPPYNWLCRECVVSIQDLSSIRRPSAYELMARKGGMEAAGDFLSSLGKTDLAEFEEEEALMLVGKIWDGCAKEMRRLVREGAVPF